MNISTFKDENYNDIDKISVFAWIIYNGKTKLTHSVYCAENNPTQLLKIAKSLEQQKANFEKLFDETLSDEEFFKLYKQFYRWDSKAIIANCNQQTFPNPKRTVIKTNDVVSHIEQEGHGRDFSWWTVWNNSAYEVLTNADFQLEDRVYTKEEIAELVRQKKMIVLRDDLPYGDELNSSEAYKTSKKLEPIKVKTDELHYKFDYYGHAIEDKDIQTMCKDNPMAIPAIRQDLTVERLSQDYQRYIVEYDRTMSQIDKLLQKFLKGFKEPKPDTTFTNIKTYLQSKANQSTTTQLTAPTSTTPVNPTSDTEMSTN